MYISKEDILDKISEYDIMLHYLTSYHTGSPESLRAGKHISNPFLGTSQKTPSFNIYQAKGSDNWLFKDFATDDKGDCFNLVEKLFNLNFQEALQKIASDFSIITSNPLKKSILKPIVKSDAKHEFKVEYKEFSSKELAFWIKYGIDEPILNLFNVKSINSFSSITKENKPFSGKSKSNYPIYGYSNSNWVKIYKPIDSKYRFLYLGSKDPDFIFGLNQLPSTGQIVFITGGEKDVMCLTAHGYNAVSLNSETASLDNMVAKELKSRFEHVIVLYDMDETGIKHSDLLSIAHGIYQIKLSKILNDGKDISDFFANGGLKDDLNSIINQTISNPKQSKIDSDKNIFNAVELLAMGNNEQHYLMEPIFPQKGTAVLAGKPDTGKSQFVRQLCIHIALGIGKFLGFNLMPVYKRAIYIATEDNTNATSFLLNKQLKGLDTLPLENLRFMFADTMTQDEIIDNLNLELRNFPSDLVIIDSFGDIFTGKDSNNNMAMRNTVKLFDKIAQEHNCLILFVHHINKAAYKQTPGQEHIQGGSALVQKVRLAMQLSEGEGDVRYLTVVKGNYCPKEYKQNSMELIFSEKTFLFENTGKLIPTNKISYQPDNGQKGDNLDELKNLAQEIFKNDILSYGKFTERYCQSTGKSVPTAKRAHTKLRNHEIITDCNSGYKLSNPVTESNLFDDEISKTYKN